MSSFQLDTSIGEFVLQRRVQIPVRGNLINGTFRAGVTDTPQTYPGDSLNLGTESEGITKEIERRKAEGRTWRITGNIVLDVHSVLMRVNIQDKFFLLNFKHGREFISRQQTA